MGNDEGNMMAAPLEHAKGAWQQLRQYAAEVKTETKRVAWPGMQEVYGTTIMVILTTFVFGIYFWICDQAFQSGISQVLRRFIHRG
jgi:preprotein translocase SecE subunit